MTIKPTYKTVIVIWSDFDAAERELTDIAREAEEGNAYCSRYRTELVEDPATDQDWDTGALTILRPFEDA